MKYTCPECGGHSYISYSNGTRQCVHCLPDVVHVVRCKNCVHYNDEYGQCLKSLRISGDNGFCESGEEEKTVSRKCGDEWHDGAKNL